MAEHTILVGDVMTRLAELPDKSVRTCVTSPPYWGLRDYGTANWIGGDEFCDHRKRENKRDSSSTLVGSSNAEGFALDTYKTQCPKCGANREDKQLGLESTPEEYVTNLVNVFRQVKRVLTDDGTLWLNLGDSYVGTGSKGEYKDPKYADGRNGQAVALNNKVAGLKSKDLVGIPWRVAFALQADGWYLRQDIIWAKPNPMPESVRDRCTKSHEYLFMLSKSPRYYYDNEAIKEPLAASSLKRIEQSTFDTQTGGEKDYGNTGVNPNRSARKTLENFAASVKMPPIGGRKQTENGNPTYSGNQPDFKPVRNKRSVWTIPTRPFKGAHFAVMPEALVEPCVLAGSAVGDTVLDPFTGSGTVAVVALKHGRSFIGTELNPEYAEIAEQRIASVAPTLDLEGGVA